MSSRAAEQQSLFDGVERGGPPGLRYERDFIGREEERELLGAFRSLPFHDAEYRGYTAKRRIVSYGAGYDFDTNVLRPAPPLPPFLWPLRAKVEERLELASGTLTLALVTEYRPGTQLGWHRDVPDFGLVAGISLGSACTMRFRPYPPRAADPVFMLELAPRSLYALAGAARWKWQHGIVATPGLRHSITFRTLSERARKPQHDH
jgi:alkylated DNA repair dioxygenase AlkB